MPAGPSFRSIPHLEEVEGLPAYRDLDALPVATLDQVSFYVPPHIGVALLEQVGRKKRRARSG